MLFAEQDLTFTKVFDMAVRAENAKGYQKEIKAEFSEVNKTTRSQAFQRRGKHQSWIVSRYLYRDTVIRYFFFFATFNCNSIHLLSNSNDNLNTFFK